MLTDSQKHQFETLGFICLKNLIPPDEMQIYIDAFDETMIQANNGVPWNQAPKRQQVVSFYRHNTDVYNRLLDDDRIYQVVQDLIGKDFVFTVSEGIHHFGGTSWHHDDVSSEGHTHLKIVLFLDPVCADTGCPLSCRAVSFSLIENAWRTMVTRFFYWARTRPWHLSHRIRSG